MAASTTSSGDLTQDINDGRPVKLLFIKAADSLSYQEVISAMDLARGAGVQVLGLVPRASVAGEP